MKRVSLMDVPKRHGYVKFAAELESVVKAVKAGLGVCEALEVELPNPAPTSYCSFAQKLKKALQGNYAVEILVRDTEAGKRVYVIGADGHGY